MTGLPSSLFRVVCLLATSIFLPGTTAAAATPKPEGFDPKFDGMVHAVLVQPDGKIVLGGAFTEVHPGSVGAPTSRYRLVRFNGDGSLDPEFAPAFSGPVKSLALDAEGRLLVGGGFAEVVDGDEVLVRSGLARVLPDGQIDRGFAPLFLGAPAWRSAVESVAVLPDGGLLVGGSFQSVGYADATALHAIPHLVRFSADGQVDPTFDARLNHDVLTIAVEEAGSFYIGGAFTAVGEAAAERIARFDTEGNFDSGHPLGADNLVRTLALEVDGALLVGGDFLKLRGQGEVALAPQIFLGRFMADGTRDVTFHPRPNARVTALAVDHAGRIMVGGDFDHFLPLTSQAPTVGSRLARLLRNGGVDSTFRPQPSATVNAIALQEDGGVVIGGRFTQVYDGVVNRTTNRAYAARVQENGRVETSFSPGSSASIFVTAERADGSIYVGGSFTHIGGIARTYLALLQADGEIDESFSPDLDGYVDAMVVQSDGKIVIGGGFTLINGEAHRYLARLNADGSVDESYDPQPNNVVQAMILESDGQITVGGSFTSFSPDYDADTSPDDYEAVSRQYLARITTAGTIDANWNPTAAGSVSTLVRQPDGRTLVGGAFAGIGSQARNFVARLEIDGEVDKTFDPSPNGAVHAMALQADGSIVMGGAFTLLQLDDQAEDDDDEDGFTDDDADRSRLVRIKSDGTLDLTYRPVVNDTVVALHVLADGDLLVGGSFTRYAAWGDEEDQAARFLLRLNPDGSRDDSAAWQTSGPVGSLVGLADGSTLVGGTFLSAFAPDGRSVRTAPPLFRYTADVGVDETWHPRGVVSDDRYIAALSIQRDGYIVAGGQFGDIAGIERQNVARFAADGSIDTSFPLRSDGAVNALFDRVPTGIWDTLRSPVAWLNPLGQDLAGANYSQLSHLSGRVSVAVRESDGNILLGGFFTNPVGTSGSNLARLRPDGTFDPNFRPNPDSTVTNLVPQPDGKIVIVGSFNTVGGVTQSYVARLQSDGTLDPGFKPKVASSVYTVALQADGKVLIGGGFRTFNVDDGEGDDDDGDGATDDDTRQPYLARLNPDGTLDKSFVPAPSAFVYSILVHDDGTITIGGEFTSIASGDTSTTRAHLARLDANGLLVEGFDPAPNGIVWDLVQQPDGKLLVAGEFTLFSKLSDGEGDDDDGDGDVDADGNAIADEDADAFFIARLNADGTFDQNFSPIPNRTVRAMELQPDGRIILSGEFSALFPNDAEYGTGRAGLARINPDGTVDTTFNPNPDDEVFAILALPDGNTLIGGDFTTLGQEAVLYIGGEFAHLNDVDLPRLARVQPDGNPDGAYRPAPDAAVRALVGLPDGRLLVGGAFTTLFGTSRPYLGRLEIDGRLDPSFAPEINGELRAIVIDQEGGLIIAGAFTVVNGEPRGGLARINHGGELDAGWTPTIEGTVDALAVTVDGRLVIGGDLVAVNGVARDTLARLHQDGTLDSAFTPTIDGRVNAVSVRADNRLTLGGAFATINGTESPRIATLNTDGSLWAAGDAGTNGTVLALALDREGRAVAGGTFARFGEVSRSLLGRTRIDSSFGQAMAIDADGRGLTWLQTGGAAAPAAVRVAVSTGDGDWIDRGLATRVAGADAWRWTGAPLPIEGEYTVRVRMLAPGTRWGSGSRREYVRHFSGTRPSGYGYGSTLPFRFGAADAPLGAGLPGNVGWVYDGGNGTTGPGGGSGSDPDGTIDVLGSRLRNVSTRVALQGSDDLTLGFVIEGTEARRMLLRAIGPGLAPYLEADVMAAPSLTLHDADNNVIAVNTGWNSSTTMRQWFAQSGAFALVAGSADAVLAPELDPGLYTMLITDRVEQGGVVLAEIYDLGSVAVEDRISNLSTRSRAGEGDASFVVGFVVEGTVTKRLLIRGIGPALAGFGVEAALTDVAIDVRNAAGDRVAHNDNWGTPVDGGATAEQLTTATAMAGAFALSQGSADAAVLLELPPGVYTVELDKRSDVGEQGLIEIYEIEP